MAAEAKKEALRDAKHAVVTVKALKQRVSFLEHKTQREVEARERLSREVLSKSTQVRELREELRALSNNGRARSHALAKSKGGRGHANKSPGGRGATTPSRLSTFDFTSASDHFDEMAGRGAGHRGDGGADDNQSAVSISDDEEGAAVDVDAGVNTGEYQLARVGSTHNPTAAVAVLAPKVSVVFALLWGRVAGKGDVMCAGSTLLHSVSEGGPSGVLT